jgi:mannosyl-glycoprotein endo-beta-N-acetylglucosaminidase
VFIGGGEMETTELPSRLRKYKELRTSSSVMKKAVLPTICFAALSTVAFEAAIFAETNAAQVSTTIKYVNIAKGSLNLRSGASTQSAVISSLTKGTAVTVYSESNGWAKVNANGKVGYVSTSYLSAGTPANSAVNPSTAVTTKYVDVSKGTLNLRNAASTSSAVMAALTKGTSVTVYWEANGWAKVNANGKDGFVSSKYLASQKQDASPIPVTPTSPAPAPQAAEPISKYVKLDSGSLNMRNGASTSSSVIVKLAKGTQVKVLSESAGWAKIEVYGKTGFVSSTYLSKENPSTVVKPTEAPAPTTIKYVNVSPGSNLNVRKSPSATSGILTKLQAGTEVTLYSEANGWAKIKVNGVDGYVSSEYLSPAKANSSTVPKEEPKTVTKYVNVSLASPLNMRTSPSTEASILTKLARGVEVTVISESEGWAKIEAYGQNGYVDARYLSETKPVAGSEPTPSDNKGEDSTTADNSPEQVNDLYNKKFVNVIYGSSLNMRSEPTTKSVIVTKLARGTIVVVESESNGWSKVTANGKTGYISSQYLSNTAPFNPNTAGNNVEMVYENYDISLDEMVKVEMKVSQQTDKKYDTYIRSDALTLNSPTTGTVTGSVWNLRGGAGTEHWTVGQVKVNENLQILEKVTGSDGYEWYKVAYNKTWVNASPEDVGYYINPNNFLSNNVDSLQFLKLSVSANLNPDEINQRILSGKGILQGTASSFVTAASMYGINEIYLISHALLETSNGNSPLANGVEVNGKKVYNMFGIGAYDNSALESGSQFAYNAGWFTPEDAIIGGAQFIANGYINAGQDTLYKMRWNPASASTKGYASHQYATDIGWAAKQVYQINNLYSLLDSYKLYLEIPQYK